MVWAYLILAAGSSVASYLYFRAQRIAFALTFLFIAAVFFMLAFASFEMSYARDKSEAREHSFAAER
jgi:hypothetical protein